MTPPLSPFAVDSLRRLAERGQALPSLTYPGCELSAYLELACAHHDWRSRGAAPEACALVERWARIDEHLGEALQALAGVRLPVDPHVAPTTEFVRLGSREALLEAAGEFFMRFRRRIALLVEASSATASSETRHRRKSSSTAISRPNRTPSRTYQVRWCRAAGSWRSNAWTIVLASPSSAHPHSLGRRPCRWR